MSNVFVLNNEQRKQLIQRFKAEKATVVWLYGPGIFFPDNGPSAANISSLLGIKFTQSNDKVCPEEQAVPELGDIQVCNPATVSSGPWFIPESGFDQVLARSSDGQPMLVKWQGNGITNYFSVKPNLSPDMLRYIAQKTGVKIFYKGNDPVHIGNDFIVLHAKTGGDKLINIPPGMRLKSVFGPLKNVLKPGEKFSAVAGRTYGFQLIK